MIIDSLVIAHTTNLSPIHLDLKFPLNPRYFPEGRIDARTTDHSSVEAGQVCASDVRTWGFSGRGRRSHHLAQRQPADYREGTGSGERGQQSHAHRGRLLRASLLRPVRSLLATRRERVTLYFTVWLGSAWDWAWLSAILAQSLNRLKNKIWKQTLGFSGHLQSFKHSIKNILFWCLKAVFDWIPKGLDYCYRS